MRLAFSWHEGELEHGRRLCPTNMEDVQHLVDGVLVALACGLNPQSHWGSNCKQTLGAKNHTV